jgi:large subunit ribosomal protein L30
MTKLAAIRIRGTVEVGRKIADSLDKLKLRRPGTLVIYDDRKEIRAMMQAGGTYLAWGELSAAAEAALKKKLKGNVARLHPPRGGFRKSAKALFPAGEGGYRGEKINELIIKMSA